MPSGVVLCLSFPGRPFVFPEPSPSGVHLLMRRTLLQSPRHWKLLELKVFHIHNCTYKLLGVCRGVRIPMQKMQVGRSPFMQLLRSSTEKLWSCCFRSLPLTMPALQIGQWTVSFRKLSRALLMISRCSSNIRYLHVAVTTAFIVRCTLQSSVVWLARCSRCCICVETLKTGMGSTTRPWSKSSRC